MGVGFVLARVGVKLFLAERCLQFSRLINSRLFYFCFHFSSAFHFFLYILCFGLFIFFFYPYLQWVLVSHTKHTKHQPGYAFNRWQRRMKRGEGKNALDQNAPANWYSLTKVSRDPLWRAINSVLTPLCFNGVRKPPSASRCRIFSLVANGAETHFARAARAHICLRLNYGLTHGCNFFKFKIKWYSSARDIRIGSFSVRTTCL